jgi:hypothetical protein
MPVTLMGDEQLGDAYLLARIGAGASVTAISLLAEPPPNQIGDSGGDDDEG